MTVAEHPGQNSLKSGGRTERWTARSEAVDLFFSTILLPIDFLALTAAFATAYSLQVELLSGTQRVIGLGHFLTWLLILAPLWVLAFAWSGLYAGSSVQRRQHEVGRVLVAVSGGVMLLVVGDSVCPLTLFPTQ